MRGKRIKVGDFWIGKHDDLPDEAFTFLIVAEFDVFERSYVPRRDKVVGKRYVAVKPGFYIDGGYTHVFDHLGKEWGVSPVFTLTRKSRSAWTHAWASNLADIDGDHEPPYPFLHYRFTGHHGLELE